MKPKDKQVVELHMDSDEFDRLMRGALAVKPPKREQKKRIRRNNRSKPGKS
jgi:hypothetical protein